MNLKLRHIVTAFAMAVALVIGALGAAVVATDNSHVRNVAPAPISNGQPAATTPGSPKIIATLMNTVTGYGKEITQNCFTNYSGSIFPTSYECDLIVQRETVRNYNRIFGAYGIASIGIVASALTGLCASQGMLYFSAICGAVGAFLGGIVIHQFAIAAWEHRCVDLKLIFADPAHKIPVNLLVSVIGTKARWNWNASGTSRWWGDPSYCRMPPWSPPGRTLV